MRKEFVCKECGGNATKEYYQENPDCKQCPEYEGCSGAINGHCLISSKESCPSCQDGHIPLPEMLMMVNEALCDANRAFKESQITDKMWFEKIWNHYCRKGGKGVALGYKQKFLGKAEHFLALAVVRLREIAEVYSFSVNKMEAKEHPNMTLSKLILHSIGCVYESDNVLGLDSVSMSYSLSGIYYIAEKENIPLEKHIDALIAYEKESE